MSSSPSHSTNFEIISTVHFLRFARRPAAMLRAFISKIWKVVNWPFLRTLPVTVLPLFTAIAWNHALVDANTDKWLYEIKDALGDVPTFRQFQYEHNDFHTMRINSNDFLAKLGFMLPEQYNICDGHAARRSPHRQIR